MILEEEILEGICNQIRIKEVKIIEVGIEEIIEMNITKEEEVGLGIDNIQIISEGVIEVIVSLDHIQEQILKETGLVAINVGNMIILPKIVQCQK